ncbi:hypothetical protein KIW84_046045 [Lathyrus oleraceus]|uniref:Uncharacterized protein n=1 Tax=Pisum sativum TaxID=3888 RepID=A0A9D4XQF6_PEA|nr:hypothetical protein KIW84_046045 [Pisum sativum]
MCSSSLVKAHTPGKSQPGVPHGNMSQAGKHGFDFCHCVDYSGKWERNSMRLALLWKENLNLNVTSFSINRIGGSVLEEYDDQANGVLSSMGFLESMVLLIERFISMVSYQVLVNGKPSRSFTPKRPPLSLFLHSVCWASFSEEAFP